MQSFLRTFANGLSRTLKSSLIGASGVRLEGARVYLRPPLTTDWTAWSELRAISRGFLTPWEPTWPNDALSYRAFVRRTRHQNWEWRNDEAYSLLIFRKDDDALLGGIALSNVRRGVAQMGTIGYWVGESYARHGYMTEATTALVKFAFGPMGLHRVEAACLPANAASRGLLLKVGFSEEGAARSYLRINGAWRDHALFGLVREDWAGRDGGKSV